MAIGSRLMIGLLAALVFAGCGPHRMTPVDPQAVGDLKPDVEDADGGLVGVRPDFVPKTYTAIVLTPFTVASAEIKDEEDARLAKDMAAYFQAQLVKRLEAAAIFPRVIDGSVSSVPPAGVRVLRLEGEIPKLTEGNQALRYFAGLYGAGAAKAQIETRLIDTETRRVQMVTADRRAASMGVFGGDGRQFVTESMEQMADGYVKLLRHLAGGGRPGQR
jgi:hypothetical protein